MATTTTPTINTYLSDMLALEQHIETPLQSQLNDADFQKLPAALRIVQEAHDTIERRIATIEARLDAVGGHAGSPVKVAVSSIAGIAASTIDKVRKTEVSKALRDDYTALSLASAAYTMLHTTALGLHDDATATLAKNHLAEVATQIIKINSILPVAVIAELQEMGVVVDASVSATAEENSENAWKTGEAQSATM